LQINQLINKDIKFRTTDSVYRQLFFFITLNLTWKIKNLSVRRTERRNFTVTSRIFLKITNLQSRCITLIPLVVTLGLTILTNIISDIISDKIKNRHKRKH